MKRLNILTFPGMGDTHWCVVKMPALMKKHGADHLTVTVWNADSKPRTKDYLLRVPFIDEVRYLDEPESWDRATWRSLLFESNTGYIKNYRGYDYFLGFNGPLRNGKDIRTQIMPDTACDFHYPVTEWKSDEEFGDEMVDRHGRFIVLYFNDLLMYKDHWMSNFNDRDIVKTIRMLKDLYPDASFLLTGKEWDVPMARRIKSLIPDTWLIDLANMTDTGQLFALLRRCTAFVGWCAGNGIMATHLGTPTVMFWSDYFESRKFATCWADPELVGKTYQPVFCEDATPYDVIKSVESAVAHGCTARQRV